MIGIKKSMKNRSAVSPVIATILMVAITVVLAAVLYVMVMGMGESDSPPPTVALESRDIGNNQYEVYVVGVTGGSIALKNTEAIVTSGPATTDGSVVSMPADRENRNLQSGDKVTITAIAVGDSAGTGNVVVMFKDNLSGKSLGQTSFTVVTPAP